MLLLQKGKKKDRNDSTCMVFSFTAVVSKESKRAPATRQMKVSREKNEALP